MKIESYPMNNYYEVLGVSKEASSFRIYKAFRKILLRGGVNETTQESVFVAYCILLEPARKYYDILLAQEQEKVVVNPKYLSMIQFREAKAHQGFQRRKNQLGSLAYKLKRYPMEATFRAFVGLLLNVVENWLGLGLLFAFVGIVLLVVGWFQVHR